MADCRALLNLGHTFAHAIESIEGLDHRHGEAVSIGLVAVTGYARRRGVIDERTAGEILSVIEDVGLPVSLPATVAVDRLMDAMRYDKKNLAGRTRLVVPHGLGNVEVHDDVDEADLRSAWAAVQR